MNSLSPFSRRVAFGGLKSFTLVELLVVLAIIAILTAISIPVIGAMFRSNQMDQGVATLTGVLEQAREAALSQNTFVWVTFTANSTAYPANGIWAATIQSQDGTESPINTTVTPSWTNTITVPGTSNLQQLYKLQNIPGVSLVLASTIFSAVSTSTSNTWTTAGMPTNSATSMTTNLTWTVTPLQNAQGFSSANFINAIEFTPDGEAHTSSTTWYNNIQFGLVPSVGSTTKNVALINISRLTGKATVYRQ